jgi:hypothetical protein
MRKMIFIIMLLLFIGLASAYQFSTIYNPYTGKQDFFQTENYTGYNVTANYFCLSSNCIQSWPSGVTGNPFNQNLNTTNSPQFAGLTLTGQLIMQSLLTSQDIIPATDNIYSLGNSTNRFLNLYAENVYANNITSDNLNTTLISTNNISSKGGQDIIIKLT